MKKMVKRKESLIHLFFHKLMLDSHYCNGSNLISRKDAMTVIGKYMRFQSRVSLKLGILDDMIKQGLLRKVNRDQLRVVQPIISKGLEAMIK